MNYYRTSEGIRISKAKIDAEVRKAKARKLAMQIDEHGYNFCEECGRSGGVRLDCSHDESVKSCQENGRSEKAFDVKNLSILCRNCHQQKDKLYLDF